MTVHYIGYHVDIRKIELDLFMFMWECSHNMSIREGSKIQDSIFSMV